MSAVSSTGIESLIKAALPSLWRFALQMTRNNHEAEELVQRTCVRALEHGDKYKEMQKPTSWLFRIAQNIWKNELRARSIRERGFVNTDEHESQFSPGSSATEWDRRTPDTYLALNEIVNAVEALPEAQRLVMILVAVNGYSYADTANILEIPIGTVMSRLARARLAIGKQFLVKDTTSKLAAPAKRDLNDQEPAVKPL